MIIALSGYAGSGKDAVGRTICELYPEWQIKKFSSKLKEIASMLTGLSVSDFEDHLVKQMTLEGNGMTVRDFLQKLGTDAIRNNLHQDSWVNALISEYNRSISFKKVCSVCNKESTMSICMSCKTNTLVDKSNTNWVVTDCRFPNEAEQIKKCGGLVVRVKRPYSKPVNGHISEIALDNYDFDYTLHNDNDIEYLVTKVKFMFRKLGITAH
jgi:hypothetical protein